MNDIVRFVNLKTSVPNVTPIFRSDVQFRVLGELFAMPGAEYAVGDLAARIGHPRPTVSHEAARLVEAGLVVRRPDGRKSLLSANMDTIISQELHALLRKCHGAVPALREAFSLPGVAYVGIYGSWAARAGGERGPLPNDIDVLVIGDLDHEQLWDTTARLSRDLGVEVNAILRSSPEKWTGDDTPFATGVRAGAMIDVVGSRP